MNPHQKNPFSYPTPLRPITEILADVDKIIDKFSSDDDDDIFLSTSTSRIDHSRNSHQKVGILSKRPLNNEVLKRSPAAADSSRAFSNDKSRKPSLVQPVSIMPAETIARSGLSFKTSPVINSHAINRTPLNTTHSKADTGITHGARETINTMASGSHGYVSILSRDQGSNVSASDIKSSKDTNNYTASSGHKPSSSSGASMHLDNSIHFNNISSSSSSSSSSGLASSSSTFQNAGIRQFDQTKAEYTLLKTSPLHSLLGGPSIWNCAQCTLENDISDIVCGACDLPRDGLAVTNCVPSTNNQQHKDEEALKENEWACPVCTFHNVVGDLKCAICEVEAKDYGSNTTTSSKRRHVIYSDDDEDEDEVLVNKGVKPKASRGVGGMNQRISLDEDQQVDWAPDEWNEPAEDLDDAREQSYEMLSQTILLSPQQKGSKNSKQHNDGALATGRRLSKHGYETGDGFMVDSDDEYASGSDSDDYDDSESDGNASDSKDDSDVDAGSDEESEGVEIVGETTRPKARVDAWDCVEDFSDDDNDFQDPTKRLSSSSSKSFFEQMDPLRAEIRPSYPNLSENFWSVISQ